MKKNQLKGFTLIELLMVIAIIGILAGILIPTVGAVRKQANIAASKSQLANYVTAMNMFKGEYGYYPLAAGTGDSTEIDLDTDSSDFMKALSGRDPESGALVEANDAQGNRRRIAFHSFSESELHLDATDLTVADQLADRFNNTNLFIVVDTDGDGFVSPDGPDGEAPGRLKMSVTAYADANGDDNFQSYTLWN